MNIYQVKERPEEFLPRGTAERIMNYIINGKNKINPIKVDLSADDPVWRKQPNQPKDVKDNQPF